MLWAGVPQGQSREMISKLNISASSCLTEWLTLTRRCWRWASGWTWWLTSRSRSWSCTPSTGRTLHHDCLLTHHDDPQLHWVQAGSDPAQAWLSPGQLPVWWGPDLPRGSWQVRDCHVTRESTDREMHLVEILKTCHDLTSIVISITFIIFEGLRNWKNGLKNSVWRS